MRAMVLAAGLGTRLRPLTLERPKPVVPVGGRPLLAYTLAHLKRSGVTEVVLNAHHLADVLEDALPAAIPAGLPFCVLREPELLGTGGALRAAARALNDGSEHPVVVMNGDVLFAPDLGAAIALHRERGALATMILRPHPDPDSIGSVEIDGRGQVRRLLGKPQSSKPLRKLMFTGVHLLSPRAFRDMPEKGCVIRQAYRRWVDDREEVFAHVEETASFQDLGTIEAYLEANLAVARAAGDRGWIDPSAEIAEGAVLRECVVGEGASIGPEARLERVVVWDGAKVDGPLEGAIVTRSTVVKV